MKPTRVRVVAIALALAAGGLPSMAQATPRTVDWPTYFRTGPGTHFVAIEELSRGIVVDVQSCDGQWCQVQVGRVTGYVEANNLADQAPLSAFKPPATDAGCFDSQRAGYQNGEKFKYCPR